MSSQAVIWLARDRVRDLHREASAARLARQAKEVSSARGVPGAASSDTSVTSARRRSLAETLAIGISVVAFGLTYGMAARVGGLSLVELEAMNLLVFAGGSQLMAIGLLTAGLPWLAIVAVTAVLNARHMLYSTALAPWFARRPRLQKALAAHVVVDETFALSLAHFRRLGRFDARGYAVIAGVLAVSWFLSTGLGWASVAVVPVWMQTSLGVMVPAAIAGMAVLLVVDVPTLVAAAAAAAIAIVVGSLSMPAVGIVTGSTVGMTAAALLGSRWPADSTDDVPVVP